MTRIDTRQLRQKQKDWLDDIHQRSGDNFLQMTDACNRLADKYNAKTIGKETLRQFYNDNQAKSGDRTLSDKTVFLLYKAYELEPSFDTGLLYKMDEDDSEISQYAKFCKQYITDLSLAKGIYRVDLGRAVGISDTTISRLFNNKLPKGLLMKTLENLREHYGYNFSPSFRAFLAQNSNSQNEDVVPIIGYFSLKNGQVFHYAEEDRKVIELSGSDAKRTRAIEMKGPTINGMVKDGMVAFYTEPKKAGVADECIDATCIVTLPDGSTSLRLIEPGHKRGLYRLHSLIDGSVIESELSSAAKLFSYTQR